MERKIFIAALALACCLSANAQKGNIGYVYPAGAQRGTTVEVTVGGQNLSKAKGIIVSGEGVSGEMIPSEAKAKKRGRKNKDIGEEDNLQLADQVRFRLSVSKDAELGFRDLRLLMPDGTTNRLYFEIGELPDVFEDGAAELSAVSGSLPVTFNGQVLRSDKDRFRFRAPKGADLVLQVKGRVFVPYMADAVPGWFQPIIRLYGPDGAEVAFSDDYRWNVDPVLFFKVPATGDYEVEINDALYRGREDFVYRIDVGELPFITSVSPLGGAVGAKNKISLKGYNLKSSSLVLKTRSEGRVPVSMESKDGLHSNTMWFYSDPSAQFKPGKGASDGNSREGAWALPSGETCERVFSAPLEQHWYSVEVTDSKPMHFSVLARRLGAPTDVRLTLYDWNLGIVKDVDDFEDSDEYLATHFADPELTVRLNPGRYYLRLVEAQAHAGDEYAYRLRWAAAEPDFSLRIEPATISIPAGGTAVFSVIMTPKQSFHGEVDIAVDGLPAGFKLSGNKIDKNRRKTLVSVTAPTGAEPVTLLPRVTGTSTAGNGRGAGASVTREAVPVESMMQAFYYTHLMPMSEFRVEVGAKQPFRVQVVPDWNGVLRLRRGGKVPVKVRLDRDPGFNSQVTLMVKSSEHYVKAEAVVVPEGETDAVLELSVPDKVKNKQAVFPRLSVYGVVKGSSAKIAGKGRNAYVASVTAYSPVFTAVVSPTK